jgi:hypothetical protein
MTEDNKMTSRYDTLFPTLKVTEAKMEEEERCRGLSMGFTTPFVSGEAEVNGCAGSSNDKKTGSTNIHSTSTITSIGSKPGEDSACMIHFSIP